MAEKPSKDTIPDRKRQATKAISVTARTLVDFGSRERTIAPHFANNIIGHVVVPGTSLHISRHVTASLLSAFEVFDRHFGLPSAELQAAFRHFGAILDRIQSGGFLWTCIQWSLKKQVGVRFRFTDFELR